MTIDTDWEAASVLTCFNVSFQRDMTMSTFKPNSRVDIDAHIAERRGADNFKELTTRGDYHQPFGKAEARAEAAKWLCLI